MENCPDPEGFNLLHRACAIGAAILYGFADLGNSFFPDSDGAYRNDRWAQWQARTAARNIDQELAEFFDNQQ